MRTGQRHTPSGEYATELTGFEQRLLTGLAAVVAAGDDQARDLVAAPAAPGRRHAGRVGSVSWRLRLAAAAVAAVAVAATVQAVGVGPSPVRDRAGGGAPASAAELGARAAEATRTAPDPYPRPGQWVYSKTMVAGDVGSRLEGRNGKVRVVEYPAWGPRIEEWWVQAGQKPGWATQAVTNQGANEMVGPLFLRGLRPLKPPSLPTDPDRLLRVIYREVERNPSRYGPSTTSTDELAFRLMAELLGGLLAPPELRAALFEAMAKIPGVIVVQDAIDAAGRHGVALARVEDQIRFEVILDTDTYRYLGQARIVTADHLSVPASPVDGSLPQVPMREGQVLYRTAQLSHGFVDAPHQRPGDPAE